MTPASIDELRAALRTPGEVLPDGPVVAGVSGGMDSMVLLELLVEAEIPLTVVHVNYGLRGEASIEDETLVQRITEAKGVPFLAVAGDARGRAGADGMSVQEAARAIRYETFIRIAREQGARSVAVAHHAEDQAETVLLNLLRGSGPEGLAGMRTSRKIARDLMLVRPLLGIRKADIEQFARGRSLEWRDDASNACRDYRRSVIRHDVLPKLDEAAGGDAVRSITRSAELLGAYTHSLLKRELRRRFRAVRVQGERALSLEALLDQPHVWQGRILMRAVRRWTDSEARRSVIIDLMNLTAAQVGRSRRVGASTVWRERDRLAFRERKATPGFAEASIGEWGGTAMVPGGIVTIELVSAEDLENARRQDGSLFASAEFVRADSLRFPLTVRPWRTGDRIRPFGMDGSKKVSDLLTDARVESHRRSDWLVMESAGEIVWVMGQRIAASIALRGESGERVARLTFVRQERSAQG